MIRIKEGVFEVKIAEVSKMFDISADTLRYYERIGLIVNVARNKGGIREYSEEDLQQIEFVKCMRNAGLSIESLIAYFDLLREGEHTLEKRHDLLLEEREKIKKRMTEMEKSLDRLNHKISLYEEKMEKNINDIR